MKRKRYLLLSGAILITWIAATLVRMKIVSDSDTISDAVSVPSAGLELAQEQEELSGPFTVLKVIDGDTITIKDGQDEITVRLIGIDAPESVHPQEEKNTPEGEAAAEWLKDLLTDNNVYLEYDIEREDKYGRTLAYVYLDDRTTMVNQLLLQQGLAEVLIIYPNIKHEQVLNEVQKGWVYEND